ncbi:M12 family metallo-peptidase [Thalassotalea ponticola]|uniref:reprolysin-like metallopeptidase n=1 Tax=Thalassotalea ponticola TaxID=1523392 RepID=UPI0025B5381E|nr:M12 family metallo-peptidase [Thalassotalea ponticola]MDN3653119.1 M12 family metallo-peptidase [Thalassotalea ponticola]
MLFVSRGPMVFGYEALWQNKRDLSLSNNAIESAGDSQLSLQRLSELPLSTRASSLRQKVFKRLNSSVVDHPSAIYHQPFASIKATLSNARPEISLPLASGQHITVALRRNRVIPTSMQTRYPDIQSFDGVDVQTGQTIASVVISGNKLYANITHGKTTTYIDALDHEYYYVRDKYPLDDDQERIKDRTLRSREGSDDLAHKAGELHAVKKTYRIAFATTYEYSRFFGGDKNDVLAALVNLVNRINVVMRRDLAIDFVLAEDSDFAFFVDSNDPFANDDSDIYEAPYVLATYVGNDKFDLGHVLTTTTGGIAGVGVACDDDLFSLGEYAQGAWKAAGASGNNSPDLDSFYIDFVAHEIGHQLGAEHSFNGVSGTCSGNRVANSAFEPGSGSTIMSYAGLCDDQNIQSFADDYFHIHSVLEVRQYLTADRYGIGNSCGVSWQEENQQPTISAEQSIVIPANTPFVLSAKADDGDADQLTYNFEQYDLGRQTNSRQAMIDNGDSPIFRSFVPSTRPYRYFPSLQSIVSGRLQPGESYPTTERTMNFKVSVRDQQGNLSYATVSVEVDPSAGPFTVDRPSKNTVLTEQATTEVVWQVANTDSGNVQCKYVDITLSANGGDSFAYPLLTDTNNDGRETVSLPAISSSDTLIKVACSTSSFFALSTPFTLNNQSTQSIVPVISGQRRIVINEDQTLSLDLNDIIVDDDDSQYPEQFTVTVLNGDNYSNSRVRGINTITFPSDQNGIVEIFVKVNDGVNDSEVFVLQVFIQSVNDAPEANDDEFVVLSASNDEVFDVLANDTDVDLLTSDDEQLRIVAIDYNGPASVRIEGDYIVYNGNGAAPSKAQFNYTIEDALGAQSTATIRVRTNAETADKASAGGGLSMGQVVWLWLLVVLKVTHKLLRCSGKRPT